MSLAYLMNIIDADRRHLMLQISEDVFRIRDLFSDSSHDTYTLNGTIIETSSETFFKPF